MRFLSSVLLLLYQGTIRLFSTKVVFFWTANCSLLDDVEEHQIKHLCLLEKGEDADTELLGVPTFSIQGV